MKTLVRLLSVVLILVALACLQGCATASAQSGDAGLVQSVLDKVLPADFSGPAHVEHRNAYFDVTIDAGGLRRTERGWTWSWLTYERNSHFPVWSSSGRITLGSKPALP